MAESKNTDKKAEEDSKPAAVPQAKPVSALKPKKKRKFLSFIALCITSILLLLVLIVAFTQTSLFKNWLTGYILDKVNIELGKKESILTCKSIDGNFFSEIILDSASLKMQNDEMVRIDHIKITFDIFKVLNKQVYIKEIIVQNPSVNLFKIKNNKGDSVWNYAYLFSSTEEKPKDTTGFDWKITGDRVKIENLNLVMLNGKPSDLPISSFLIKPSKSLDIDNLKISSFNLETSMYYDKNSTQLEISQLDFNSNFGLDLKGLSGNFYVAKSRAEVNKLNIETDKSWVQMDYVFIDKLDLTDIAGLESFKNKDMRLSLIAKDIDFDDLKSFLPALDFLDNKVYCELKAKGKFDDVQIEKLILKTANSDMSFKGRMSNLTDPVHLHFDIAADNITMDPVDTKIYTPGLPIPDYSHLGKVFGSFTYKGEPTNFQTTFDIRSSAGNSKGFFNLNLTVPNFSYSSSLEASNVNVGKIVKDQSLESDINGKIEFAGSGFSPANVNTKITYDINNTKLYGQSIDKSAGTITLVNYNADLNLTYLAKNLNTEVAGTFNYADIKNPKYNLKGKVNNLNIEDFTKNAADRSDLDFAFEINGSGISPDNLEGTYNIQLANSFYGKYNLPSTPIDLKLALAGANNLISLNSNLLDFKAEGSFKVTEIVPIVMDNVTLLMNEYSKRLALDTMLPVKQVTINNSAMDFTYELRTKDPSGINRLIHGLNFDGTITGNIKNSANGFDARSNLKVNNFSYADSQFVLKNTKADIWLTDSYSENHSNPKGSLRPFTYGIDVTSDVMKIGQAVYDSVDVNLNLGDRRQVFSASLKRDTLMSLAMNGRIRLDEDSINVIIPSISLLYNKVYVQNDDTLLFTYSPNPGNNTIKFKKFKIAGDYLKVNLSGYYSLNQESDLTAEVDELNLAALFKFIYNPEGRNDPQTVANMNKQPMIDGDIRRVSLNFKGTTTAPILSFEMNSGLLRYQNSKVGRMDAFLDYADNILNTDILVSNAQGVGKLRVTGDVPFNNPLKESDSASYYSVMSRPANLVLKADDFQINFFSRLIPNFTELRGILNGSITTSGTIQDPLLNGALNIDKGRFYSEVNGLYYRFFANLKADKSDLIVDKFSLFYEDDDTRHIDAWGKLNFAGLKLNYIDLATSGDVKVLDRSSPTNRFGFYGDMIAGIGTPGVTIKGDLNNLVVSGKLLVKDANLIFPSLQGLAYNVYEDNFTYKILTDSIGYTYLDTQVVVTPDKINEIDPFLLYNQILEQKEPSAIDFITFDFDVETQKNVFVSITFNSLTREEMFGEIQGKMVINNRTYDKHFQFFGNMNIVGDSYYRYYKNFAINNSAIIFEGDPLNPRINIHAQYTNVREVDNNPETMYIMLEITGTRKEPKLAFSLKDSKGQVSTGGNAESDALSYLLFGQPTTGQGLTIQGSRNVLSSLGTSTGSGILSSFLLGAIRDVAPFIINTEVNYTGGNFSSGTDIRITSQLGDALVKFGGKVLSDINNAEVSIDYPLNKLLNIDVSNNLILEIYRQIKTGDLTGDRTVYNGVSLIYKINF